MTAHNLVNMSFGILICIYVSTALDPPLVFYRQRHKEDLNAFKQFNIIAYKFFVPKYEAVLFSDPNSYHTFFCTILIYMFTYFNRLNFNRRFHEHIYIFCKGCSKIQIFQSGTSHIVIFLVLMIVFYSHKKYQSY